MGFTGGYCHNRTETIGIAQAPAFDGPYTLRKLNSIFNDSHPSEDPYLWVDSRGWHVIGHDLTGSVSYYAYSRDGINFTRTPEPPYSSLVAIRNGTSTSYIECDVERPQMLFDDEGKIENMVSTCNLTTGLTFDYGNRYY